MPTLKTYDLFISHAWTYNDDYYRLEKLLDGTPNFDWRNYSVPEHDPLIDPNKPEGKSKLEAALDEQVRQATCVLVIGGMYVAHRVWIQKEIDIAKSYNKPIIALSPWGQEKMPKELQEIANEVVGWNASTIVEAIRRHG